MSKKETLRHFHQESIANAADCLFQEQGVEKTTVDQIARAADYSKATIYVYFKNKDDIFYYIVNKAMQMLLACMDAGISSSNNALEQYHNICIQISAFAAKYPFYYESLTQTIATDLTSRSELPILEDIYQTGEQVNEKCEIVLHNGKQQGYFREDADNVQTGFLFWATLSGVIGFANNKSAYIEQRMGMTQTQFLNFSFQTLLRSVLKEGVEYEIK